MINDWFLLFELFKSISRIVDCKNISFSECKRKSLHVGHRLFQTHSWYDMKASRSVESNKVEVAVLAINMKLLVIGFLYSIVMILDCVSI